MRKNARLLYALTVIAVIIAGIAPWINGGVSVLAQDDVQTDDPYKAHQSVYERFTARDNGVVFDTKDNLEWFVGPDEDTTWDEAKSWAESLSVDGGGWRMPTRDELSSLYTKGVGSQNMSPLLKTTGGFVWTGETVSTSYAWGFCFEIGDAYWPLRTYTGTARGFAVRPAKP
jgi:hypothetical protein